MVRIMDTITFSSYKFICTTIKFIIWIIMVFPKPCLLLHEKLIEISKSKKHYNQLRCFFIFFFSILNFFMNHKFIKAPHFFFIYFLFIVDEFQMACIYIYIPQPLMLYFLPNREESGAYH